MAKVKTEKTNAMRILENEKIPFQLHTYDCDEFMDGMEIARTIGLDPDIVYKTLVTIGKSKEHYVFVIPVNAELDMKKAALAAKEKSIEMLPLKDLTPVTGYIRGGCTAIGMKKTFRTFLAQGAQDQPTITVSGGKRGIQLTLTTEHYLKASKGTLADIVVC